MKKFPNYKQLDVMDCGPTCLRIIAKYYGKQFTVEYLRDKCEISREGVSLLNISNAAESIGFHTIAARITLNKLMSEAPLPCIVHLSVDHFAVVYKIKKDIIYVSDPVIGLVKYSKEEFIANWTINDKKEGIILLIEPTPEFFANPDEQINKSSFKYIFSYITRYKKLIALYPVRTQST